MGGSCYPRLFFSAVRSARKISPACSEVSTTAEPPSLIACIWASSPSNSSLFIVTVTINNICHCDAKPITPHPQNQTHVKVLSKDTQGARFAVYPLWPCSGGKPPDTPKLYSLCTGCITCRAIACLLACSSGQKDDPPQSPADFSFSNMRHQIGVLRFVAEVVDSLAGFGCLGVGLARQDRRC